MTTIQKEGNYFRYGSRTVPDLVDNQQILLVAEKNFSANTDSTTAISVGTMVVGNVSIGDLYAVEIKDTAGRRSNYFLSDDQFCRIKTTGSNPISNLITADSSGTLITSTSSAGVYVSATSLSGSNLTLTISAKYSASTSKTINSTYRVRVYKVVL